jgi:hypothetical protein
VVVHFCQILSLLIQDFQDQETDFFKKIEAKVLEMFDKYDFFSGGCGGKLMENLLELYIFLDSQYSKLVNNPFLSKLRSKLTQTETEAVQTKYKKLLNLYLAYGCTLNFQRHVSENLTIEDLKEKLPDPDLLKPSFKYLNSHYKYNQSSRDPDGGSNAS